MSIFSVRAGCEIQLMSYGSKHALQSLSDKHFVGTYMYTHNLKLQVIYGCLAYRVTALLLETFLVCFELHERSTGELWPQTRISHSLIQHCVHILQTHTYIAI